MFELEWRTPDPSSDRFVHLEIRLKLDRKASETDSQQAAVAEWETRVAVVVDPKKSVAAAWPLDLGRSVAVAAVRE